MNNLYAKFEFIIRVKIKEQIIIKLHGPSEGKTQKSTEPKVLTFR